MGTGSKTPKLNKYFLNFREFLLNHNRIIDIVLLFQTFREWKIEGCNLVENSTLPDPTVNNFNLTQPEPDYFEPDPNPTHLNPTRPDIYNGNQKLHIIVISTMCDSRLSIASQALCPLSHCRAAYWLHVVLSNYVVLIAHYR